MAYATVITVRTSADREIFFATNEVADHRRVVAELVADEAFHTAETDDEEHAVDLDKILAVKIEPICNFATASDGRFVTEIPDSICADFTEFQNEIRAAIASGETIEAAFCAVE